MGFLGRAGDRAAVFALATLVATSCSSPPFRDFAAASSRPATAEPAVAALELIDRSSEPPADIVPLLVPLIEQADIPGIAAVVLHGDRVVAQGAAGVRRRGSEVRVTMEDQFGIASCAKAMSAMVVARLVEEGSLDWDRPIGRYFADDSLHPDWDHVTLRHLLTHTGGVRDPLVTFLSSTLFDRGSLTERRFQFVHRVLRAGPKSPAGSEMVYCNTDYILAAVVAEKVTGQPWEQLMVNTVFAPLRLESAGFGPPGRPGELLQPWGHGKYRLLQIGLVGNAAFDPGARTADYPAIASPAGYVHLSIRDWARFVSLHLRAHAANPHHHVGALRPETFAHLHNLRAGIAYAGGWFTGTRPWAKGARAGDTGRVLFHVGDNGRWTSAVWIAPEIDFAVLVTCNRGGMEAAVDQAVGQLMKKYHPVQHPTSSDRHAGTSVMTNRRLTFESPCCGDAKFDPTNPILT